MRRIVLPLLLCLIVLLAGCGSPTSVPPTPTPAPPTARPVAAAATPEQPAVMPVAPGVTPMPPIALMVSSQREITLEGSAAIHSLSPDGKWLATLDADKLCILDLETLAEHSCAALLANTVYNVDAASLAWSPDSQHIAFTENSLQIFIESDIWVMDVESGTLAHLTDEGVTGSILFGAPDARCEVDYGPAWSPDGKTLAFARTVRESARLTGTTLYRVSLDGGDVEELVMVSELAWRVPSAPRWSDDGSKLFYAVDVTELGDTNNCLWQVESTGENPQQIQAAFDHTLGNAMLAGTADQGNKCLLVFPAAQSALADPSVAYKPYVLLDLPSGAAEVLEGATGGVFSQGATEVKPGVVAVSPDGSMVVYTQPDPADPTVTRLAVRHVAGGAEPVLLDVSLPENAGLGEHRAWGGARGLYWSQQDTIYVATGTNQGVLLTLATN